MYPGHFGLAVEDEPLRSGRFSRCWAYTATRADENGPVLLGFNL